LANTSILRSTLYNLTPAAENGVCHKGFCWGLCPDISWSSL